MKRFVLFAIAVMIFFSMGVTCLASSMPHVGNKSTKVYHISECTYAGKISSQNRIYFSSSSEAEANGYRLCYYCRDGVVEPGHGGDGGSGSSANSGYSNGYEAGYDEGYAEGKKAGKDSGYKDGYAKGKAETKEQYEAKISDARWSAVFWTLIVAALVGIPLAVNIMDNRLTKQRTENLQQIERIRKQCREQYNTEILQAVLPEGEGSVQLPDGVWLEIDCTVIKGEKSVGRPFGDFTRYISPGGKRYHRKKGCCGASIPIHIYERPNALTPCSVCNGGAALPVPEWYRRLQGYIKESPVQATERTAKTDAAVLSVGAKQPAQKCAELPSGLISKIEFADKVLHITFIDGKTYAYHEVSEQVYQALLESRDPDVYFHRYIRNNYRFEQDNK